jgi:predicted nucleic acid-binding protein
MGQIIIADSSALVSLAITSDSNHQIAAKTSLAIKKNAHQVLIPGDVFTETINVLGKKSGHLAAISMAESIAQSTQLLIAETTPEIRDNALKIFEKQANSVSFTDCLVMAFADYYHTKFIFGFDEIFQKNHYIRPK